jgi:hypothetical protein
MLDTNETMNKRTNIQLMLDQIVDIAGDAGLDQVTEAVNGVLAKLGADVARLTALDRDTAALSGISLSELAVQRARERSIESAWAALTQDEAAALRMLDGSSADPRTVVAAKKSAERELVALSSVDRAALSRRFGADVMAMSIAAKNEGLLT